MNTKASRSTWNDRMIEDLKRLWAEGHSASQIGKRLGIGKNAVIGKSRRLGLERRPSPVIGAVRKGRRQPDKTPAHVRMKLLMQTPRSMTPYTGPNTLANLALDQCRYTASETKPFVFCAKPINSHGPYCAEHREVCYITRGKQPGEAAPWKPWKLWS